MLCRQIEENTKGLSSLNYSFSGSTSSLESIRSPTMEVNRKADGAKKTMLKWVGTVIPKYVTDRSVEKLSGFFLALIVFDPGVAI